MKQNSKPIFLSSIAFAFFLLPIVSLILSNIIYNFDSLEDVSVFLEDFAIYIHVYKLDILGAFFSIGFGIKFKEIKFCRTIAKIVPIILVTLIIIILYYYFCVPFNWGEGVIILQ